jgi:hypothetical protein
MASDRIAVDRSLTNPLCAYRGNAIVESAFTRHRKNATEKNNIGRSVTQVEKLLRAGRTGNSISQNLEEVRQVVSGLPDDVICRDVHEESAYDFILPVA